MIKMSIYEQGWLWKFLNIENQPKEIRNYLNDENRLLLKYVLPYTSLVDFGCGYGRHLELLHNRLSRGLGKEALERYNNLELKLADARKSVLNNDSFDYAICMNNTLGNIEEKDSVIAEMRRVIKPGGIILAGVYSEKSIDARIEWYERTGLNIEERGKDYILTTEGFKSWHFSKQGLHQLFGKCQIYEIAEIGYFVIARKKVV
jgi:SAM-dependent methyltransferase